MKLQYDREAAAWGGEYVKLQPEPQVPTTGQEYLADADHDGVALSALYCLLMKIVMHCLLK